MEPTLRASMNWLHTWSGVLLGGLLFAIFWMGTLSVFDREIDRWMAPMTRLAVSKPAPALDALRPFYDLAAAAKAPRWAVVLPTERDPVIRVFWQGTSGPASHLLNPASGTELPEPGTWGGSRFIYPFHYMMHIKVWRLGAWIVGLASMAMLVLCVSGVIVHRKIFVDLFAFRVRSKPRRLILDLHNVAGVLGLPFHVAITLSGLIVFYWVYFPGGWQVVYGNDQRTFFREGYDTFDRPRLGRSAPLASLDAMVDRASNLWGGVEPRSIVVQYPGDAASYVQTSRTTTDLIAGAAYFATFDAATGEFLHLRKPGPIITAQHFVAGLHLVQFRHWTLRWLYFCLGLVGCLLIATGYLFWLDSRRKRHIQLGLRGVPAVESLTIGSVTGIVIATLAFFVVNRLLPLGMTFLGQERAALEVWTFYLVWLAAFGHAWLRPGQAWIEQCRTVAALAVAAVLLNWITTGDHPIRSLGSSHLWPIAGMDLMLLGGAAIAALTARKLRHRTAVARANGAPA